MTIPVGAIAGGLFLLVFACWGLVLFVRGKVKEKPSDVSHYHESGLGQYGNPPHDNDR